MAQSWLSGPPFRSGRATSPEQHPSALARRVESRVLAGGSGPADAFFPDRIVAGGPPEAQRRLKSCTDGSLKGAIFPGTRVGGPPPLLWMSGTERGAGKYAANGSLATKLSFVNEIANIAHAVVGRFRGARLDGPRSADRAALPSSGPRLGRLVLPKGHEAFQVIAEGAGYDLSSSGPRSNRTRVSLRASQGIERAVPSAQYRRPPRTRLQGRHTDTRESPADRARATGSAEAV